MNSLVYLIGAGPGDPGLLTVKGKEILKSADIVVYDSLINKKLLGYCKKGSKHIFVGKKPGQKLISQSEINSILIKNARKSRVVVRLKGGDPFIFGRGGEEAEALVKAGLTIEIVPGVSSISAVPSYSGVPLTHRRFNSSFAVITGHQNPFSKNSKLNWTSLSHIDTLVFLMSLKNLDLITKKLLDEKMPRTTPVLVTSWGTLPKQKSVTGNLSNINKKVEAEPGIISPAVIVVGNIVNLKNSLSWYEKKPLFGKKIVVTRAEDQADYLCEMLSSLGADIIKFPTINIQPPKSWKAVDSSIRNIKNYDYVVFTSINGVRKYFERIQKCNLDSRIFNGKKIVSIGEKTAKELQLFGLKADIIPRKYTAEGIMEKLSKKDIKNQKFLIPRAKIARDFLPKMLKMHKASVTVVNCYETVIPRVSKQSKNSLISLLNSGEIDIITFTSSSTVSNLLKLLDNNNSYFQNTACASIGPVTADTLKSIGIKPSITAKKHTIEGLVDEIIRYF